MTCALPISSPSFVIKEFNAIFCDLKGATRYPSCLKIRQSPAARRLLPAFDIVPCTMIAFAILLLLLFLLCFLSFFHKSVMDRPDQLFIFFVSPHCHPVKSLSKSRIVAAVPNQDILSDADFKKILWTLRALST